MLEQLLSVGYGLVDTELKYRQRYVDLITNDRILSFTYEI